MGFRKFLASLAEGSEAGYRKLLGGKVLAAATHFDGTDDSETDVAIV